MRLDAHSRLVQNPLVRRIRLRRLFQLPWSVRRSRAECFICEVIRGNPNYNHHVIYQDDFAVAFLSRYPSLYGHCLVAPIEHREQVTGDFSIDDYLRLQEVVYRVGEAVRAALPCERLYVMSMGSQQANRHVHWHAAPLPPGVPLIRQQFAAFGMTAGVLELSDEEWESLASQLRTLVNNDKHDNTSAV